MAITVKGEFLIGGTKYIHPLTSEEIKYLLTLMRNHTFKGEELENLTVVTIKLQAEYLAVLEKEQQTEQQI
jgi:hypothetical protein